MISSSFELRLSIAVRFLLFIGLLGGLTGSLASTALAAPDYTDCYSLASADWQYASTWGCGVKPDSNYNVHIASGHVVASKITTQFANSLWLENGTLDMSGSIVINGNIYFYNSSLVKGGGTFNAQGSTGTEICTGVGQARYTDGTSGPGVNVTPAGGVTVTCSNGMIASGGWSSSGTFDLIGSSTIGWWAISSGATLKVSNGSSSFSSISNSGTLDAGTNSVSITAYSRNSGGLSSESRSTSTGLYTYPLAASTVNVLTQGSLSSVQVQRKESAHPQENFKGGGAKMLHRYYTVTPTGSGYTADLCFGYTDEEITSAGLREDRLKACRWTGSGWSCTRGANSSTSTNQVCSDPTSTFSDWVIGDVGPTAVALLSFNAQPALNMTAVLATLLALAALLPLALFVRRRGGR